MGQTAAVKMMVRKLKAQKKGPVRPDGSKALRNLQRHRDRSHRFTPRAYRDGTIVNMFDTVRQWLIFDNSTRPGHPHKWSQSFKARTACDSQRRAAP